MKSFLTLAIIAFTLISCETKNASIEKTDIVIDGRQVKLYVIDSCEYYGQVYGGNSDFLTHKGNCRLCEQRNKHKP